MEANNDFVTLVKELIHTDVRYCIGTIDNLVSIYDGYYDELRYLKIRKSIETNSLLNVDICQNENATEFYLYIYEFYDNLNGSKYIATFFEGKDYWCKPELIELFEISRINTAQKTER